MQKTANTLIFLSMVITAICWYQISSATRVIEWPMLITATIIIAFLAMVFLVNRRHQFSSQGCGIAGLVAYAAAILVFRTTIHAIDTLNIPNIITAALLLNIGLVAVLVILVALGNHWLHTHHKKKKLPIMPMELDHPPLVSIHLPIHEEPAQLVIETLNSLNQLHYPNFEIIVIDHGSSEALWQPVQQHCHTLGNHVHFHHLPKRLGFRASALNQALQYTHPDASIIAVIHADSRVDPQMLHDLVPQFQVEQVAIVHTAQHFRDANRNLFKAICSAEYRDIFHVGLKIRDRHDIILHHGKISLIRRSLLKHTHGWDESTVSEDTELDVRACEQGYEIVYNPAAYATGLTPDTFAAYRQQRFRWCFGAIDIVRRHTRDHAGRRERWQLLLALLPWLNDSLIVVTALAVLAWSIALMLLPSLLVAPPFYISLLFSLPILLKIAFQIHHLRDEVHTSIPAASAALLARFSLLHITAHALIGHFRINRDMLRTPKQASAVSWRQSLRFVREEVTLLTGLALGLAGLIWHGPALDIHLLAWLLLLTILMLPGLAALLMALISGLPFLPASLLHTSGSQNQ